MSNRQLTSIARVYMGRNRNHYRDQRSRTVSDAEVDRFVAQVVAPQYPGGWTLFRGDGGWTLQGQTEPKIEPTIVLEIANPDSNPNGIEMIADTWKHYADQEAVLVAYTDAQTAVI